MKVADLIATQNDFETAANRACDNQFNKCADVANSGKAAFEVGDCDKQNGAFVSLPSSLLYSSLILSTLVEPSA